jgi:hypothetical protein
MLIQVLDRHDLHDVQEVRVSGRPAVESVAINVHMPTDDIAVLDDWRRVQGDLPAGLKPFDA